VTGNQTLPHKSGQGSIHRCVSSRLVSDFHGVSRSARLISLDECETPRSREASLSLPLADTPLASSEARIGNTRQDRFDAALDCPNVLMCRGCGETSNKCAFRSSVLVLLLTSQTRLSGLWQLRWDGWIMGYRALRMGRLVTRHNSLDMMRHPKPPEATIRWLLSSVKYGACAC